MPDEDDKKIDMPWGKENPDDVTRGGAGSGANPNDTGGLDVNGNELGATSPETGEGKSEAERMDEMGKGTRRQ